MAYNKDMQQYFLDTVFEVNQTYSLNQEQSHHLCVVLRAKDGLLIRVVDTLGQYAIVPIHIESNTVFFNIDTLNRNDKKTNIVLLMALIKKDKWDFTLMKASELGVDEIYPLMVNRCVVKVNKEFKKARYEKILLEAAEQCKRDTVPVLHDPISLKNMPSFEGYTKFIPYEKEESVSLKQLELGDNIVFAIGPEGGFDPSEIQQFDQKGFKSVTLGKRILRAETAALYTLSAIDILKGDVC